MKFIAIDPIRILTNTIIYDFMKKHSFLESFNFSFNFKFIKDGAIIIKYGHKILDSSEMKLNTLSMNKEAPKGINVKIKPKIKFFIFFFNFLVFLFFSVSSDFYNKFSKDKKLLLFTFTLIQIPIIKANTSPTYAIVIRISLELSNLSLNRIKSGVNYPNEK